MKFIFWVKKNWADPVWSKVIAGIILAILTVIALQISALYEQIPFQQLYNQTHDYLVNETITFTLRKLDIMLITFILIVFIVPVIIIALIRTGLMGMLTSPKFDADKFLNGKWNLTFSKDGGSRGESCNIINGFEYYVGTNYCFTLENIQIDPRKNIITWSKEKIPTGPKHSTETLNIENYNLLVGYDDLGYSLLYKRVVVKTFFENLLEVIINRIPFTF